MAHFGNEGAFDLSVPRLSQGTLAEMVGTTCLWRIDTVAMKRSDPRNALQPRKTPDDLSPGFFRG
jgi:hypothetical protein